MDVYKKDDIINVEVSGIEKYGIFVNVDNDYSGLVHISEISYNYVKDIRKFAKVGDKIKVKVLEIDEENKQLKLSIKDINYRGRTGEKSKIIETPLAFSTLSKKLDTWIKEKLTILKGKN